MTLAVVMALLVVGVFAFLAPPRPLGVPGGSDLRLYGRIVARVAAGQSYYDAAPAELRRWGYSMHPFSVVRPPWLAIGLAQLPNPLTRYAAICALAAMTFAAWAWHLSEQRIGVVRFCVTLVLLASGIMTTLAPSVYLFHEAWAGLLIALSLALHRPGRWILALALGLAAALVRELAFPYLVVMACFAWLEGRRGEAVAWAAAMALAAIALAWHAVVVNALAQPHDLSSQGWLGFGGWPFVLRTVEWNVFIWLVSGWLAAPILPLALLGLLTLPGGRGRRVALIVLGFVGAICIFGRPENTYWGLMIAPLWPMGLARADVAFRALLAALRTGSRPRALDAAYAG